MVEIVKLNGSVKDWEHFFNFFYKDTIISRQGGKSTIQKFITDLQEQFKLRYAMEIVVEMFKTDKTTEELCKDFKVKAQEFIKKQGKGNKVVIDLAVLEKYFSYNAERFISIWIPMAYKKELAKIGVKLTKKRGRNLIMVEVN